MAVRPFLLLALLLLATPAAAETLEGSWALDGDVEVELRPGLQSGEILTVKDRGVTKLRGTGRGDLKVGVQVVTPSRLSSKERDLIQQFAASRKAPAPELSHFQQGLFARLRDRFLG
jgi:molecular chaperone DnaJ